MHSVGSMVGLNQPQFGKLSCRLCEAESALASCHHPATNSYSHCWPYDTESATDSYCISSTDSQFLDNPDSATDSLFYEVPGPWTNETFSTLMMRKPQNRDMNVYNSAMSSLDQCSPDISEFYDTPLTQVLNTKNDYYNLQRWLIPDTQFHIPLTNSPRIARKNSCTKLSIQHHRETRGSPWVCYYPPTPPVHHSDPVYQTILIPAPPTSPAPSPPSNGAGNNNRKRVHFSGTDEIFITQMRNDVARPLKLVVYSVAVVFLCLFILYFCSVIYCSLARIVIDNPSSN